VSLLPLERSGKVLVPFLDHSAVPARGRYRGVMETVSATGGKRGAHAACTVRIDNKLFFPEKCGRIEQGTLARFCFERAEKVEK
jgi:hypothetical protein